ncbi:MAG: patatin-like phospholipase family protein [Candidatus Margulisiibacteriota bacterium]
MQQGSGKLAFVFSGGFSKGAAHLAIAKVFIEKGFEPDIYVGTSVGAVAAVLLAFCKDADEAIELYKSFVKKYIWPQMLAVDVFSKGGIFTAEILARDMARHAGIEDATFDDLKKPVYITASDINTGRQIVFGPRGKMKLIDALEAAISLPMIFKPKKLLINNKVHALCDGGMVENCPITAAAKIPGVKRILAVDLGCLADGDIDYSNKNIADVFLRYVDLVSSYPQLKASLNDEIFKKKNISLRILNPGLADIKPFDIKSAPAVIDRTGQFAERMLRGFDNSKEFFGKWKRVPRIGKDIKILKVGVEGTNAFEVVDFG